MRWPPCPRKTKAATLRTCRSIRRTAINWPKSPRSWSTPALPARSSTTSTSTACSTRAKSASRDRRSISMRTTTACSTMAKSRPPPTPSANTASRALTPGSYVVREVVPAHHGLTVTTPAGAGATVSVTANTTVAGSELRRRADSTLHRCPFRPLRRRRLPMETRPTSRPFISTCWAMRPIRRDWRPGRRRWKAASRAAAVAAGHLGLARTPRHGSRPILSDLFRPSGRPRRPSLLDHRVQHGER